jgi:hypothetical protein
VLHYTSVRHLELELSGCNKEVAALHSDHCIQVRLYGNIEHTESIVNLLESPILSLSLSLSLSLHSYSMGVADVMIYVNIVSMYDRCVLIWARGNGRGNF